MWKHNQEMTMGSMWPGYHDLDIVFIMMTSSNGNIFRVTGPLCGEFTGPGEFPTQRPVTQSFGVFFDLCLNKRLSKQPRGWWFETPSWSLWRQCNDNVVTVMWRDIMGKIFTLLALYQGDWWILLTNGKYYGVLMIVLLFVCSMVER